jgi:hypothetical protein
MLITLERLTVVPADEMALCAFNFVGGAQVRSTLRQIREQDLTRLALRAREQNVPFTGNESTHASLTPKPTIKRPFISQIDFLIQYLLEARTQINLDEGRRPNKCSASSHI